MIEYVLDDTGGLAQLLLVDDERGREADDVPVGGLGDEALIGHCQADIPGLQTLLRLGDDGVEQSLAADGLEEGGIDPGHFLPEADGLEEGGIDFRHFFPEDLAEPLGILGQVLVADDLEGRYRHLGREREASEGGAVLAGLNGQHDLVVG